VKLHARTMHVQRARADLQLMLIKFQDERDLTDVEMLGILAHWQERIITTMLRAERHPDDPDRKADEE
jgi:hypothetical protein